MALTLLTVILLTLSTYAGESFPGYTWQQLRGDQGLASPFYTRWGIEDGKPRRPSFEHALAGKPKAVAAFLDIAPHTDGEHSFIHQRMTLLLLTHLGDRSFCRQLHRRSPQVQRSVGVNLYFAMKGPPYDSVLPVRYPRATALAQHWWNTSQPNHVLQPTAGAAGVPAENKR